ncbi:unnamed protein product [Jaminaea pallidilutea]
MVAARINSAGAVGSSTAPESAVFNERLSSLQAALSSGSDLNPIADVVALVGEKADQLNSATLAPALTLLLRTFSSLIQRGTLKTWPVKKLSGYLVVDEQPAPDDVVNAWIRARYNDTVALFAHIMIHHTKEKSRFAALAALMELQKVATMSNDEAVGSRGWSESPWLVVVQALAAEPVGFADQVGEIFTQDWSERYGDVKMALHRSVAVTPGLSRSRCLSLLLPLASPPKVKSEIKSLQDFLVPALSSRPAVSSVSSSGTRKRKTKTAKVTQDGDSSQSDSGDSDNDDDDENGGAEDLKWFSDSDEDDESAQGLQQQSAGKSGKANKKGAGPSNGRRRRAGAGRMPFHQALYDVKAWRSVVESAWLRIILGLQKGEGTDSTSLALGEINAILRVMEKRVLPFLSRPRLIADWLLDCLDVGGSTALLSLSPLYTLYVTASLSLPTLYTTLYGLLTPGLLHSPHRSHSLRLIYLFLCSEKLSLSIVAAFVKRLARCALRGPPGGIIPVTVVAYNLLKRHKDGMQLLHRDFDDDAIGAAGGWTDPFDDNPQLPPGATEAAQSCLFEMASLGAQASSSLSGDDGLSSSSSSQRLIESHYHAPTSTIVRILSQPFTKERYDVEEFLDHSYGTLLATEFRRTINVGGANGEQQKQKRKRGPGHEPAVRFSVPGSRTVLAADGRTRKTKMPKVFPRGGGETVTDADSQKQKVTGVAGATAEANLQMEGEGQEDALGESEAVEEAQAYDRADNADLDDEEREAREAMRMVEADQQRLRAEAAKKSAAGVRRDVMSLWAY